MNGLIDFTKIPMAIRQAAVIAVVSLIFALGVNHFRTSGIPLVADWSPEARLKAAAGVTVR